VGNYVRGARREIGDLEIRLLPDWTTPPGAPSYMRDHKFERREIRDERIYIMNPAAPPPSWTAHCILWFSKMFIATNNICQEASMKKSASATIRFDC
jgi:hypothetical protein